MSGLVRTLSEPYKLEQAYTIDFVSQAAHQGQESELLIPIANALLSYKSIRISGLDESLLGNGQISYNLKNQLISVFSPDTDEGVKIISNKSNKLLALIGLERGRGFVIRRVFRY